LKINSIKIVTFSPTGNSKKIAEAIAKGTKIPYEYIDLTSPDARTQVIDKLNEELTIISSPVYLGRIPLEAALRIRGLKANKTPAIVTVTFGNRAYEDALRELSDIASEVGFKTIAAGAFIGEHSWSTRETPTAEGRPDSDDLAKAKMFGEKILEKIQNVDTVEDLVLKVPGDAPYTQSHRSALRRYEAAGLMSPTTDEELCSKCGSCVQVCPTGAISIKRVFSSPSPMASLNKSMVFTDPDTCIWCAACIKNCPSGARIPRPNMLAISSGLNAKYKERKEPEMYL
jgi:ferredoxin